MKIVSSATLFLILCIIAVGQVRASFSSDSSDESDDDICTKKGAKGQCADRRALIARSSACFNENYMLSVAVQNVHLVLTAEPIREGSIADKHDQKVCPSLAFHAVHRRIRRKKHLEKAMNEIPSKEYQGLELGVFKLETLYGAYDSAPVGIGTRYKLMTNNCASFVVLFAQKLGLDPTRPEIIEFVSRELFENGSNLILGELSKHRRGLAMISANDEDGDVIKDFVSSYIHDVALWAETK